MSLFERNFEKLLLEAIDEGLSTLGESSKQAIYYHLERSFNIRKEEIPSRIIAFTQAIQSIFGVGADLIEVLIAKKLYEKVEAVSAWDESERLGFIEHVARTKRVFREKNMAETVRELVQCEEAETEV